MKSESIYTKLAREYGVSYQAVKNWERLGCPLRSKAKRDRWLASRRQTPTRLTRSIARAPTSASPPAQPLAQGLAASLKRQEEQEAADYQAVLDAVAQDDALAERIARDNWRRSLEQLRRTDLAIEESRRQSGELVPKIHLETLARELQRATYYSLMALEDVVPMLVGMNSPHDVWAVLSKVKLTAHASIVASMRHKKTDAPKWLLDAATFYDMNQAEQEKGCAEFWTALKEAMQSVGADALEKLNARKELEKRYRETKDPEERSRLWRQLDEMSNQ